MLYKYCRSDGLDIVKKSRLRLSRIDHLNDPFELVFGIDEVSAHLNLRNEYEEDPNIIRKWSVILDDQRIFHNRVEPEDILDKFTKFQISDFRRVFGILREKWNRTMGIACMSEAMDVIQMWAHYADNHKGIVVGIEENEFVKNRESIIPVCYRDKMVLFPVTGHLGRLDEIAIKLFPEVLSRKETNWSYEKEIRLYASLDEPDNDEQYYIEMPRSAIREVYLGLRSDQTMRMTAEQIRGDEQYRHLRIFKMIQHESAFKLTPQEILDG
jgi:hypothetical protein